MASSTLVSAPAEAAAPAGRARRTRALVLAGSVVTETVFAWPGIGRLAIQSIYNRDYPIVQCTVFVSAAAFVAINFLIDLLYGVLDPRLRTR